MSVNEKVLPFVLMLAFAACAAETGGGEAESEEAEAPAAPSGPVDYPLCVLETSMGTIVLELDRTKAPKSVNNFEVHVNSGFYNGLQWHRVINTSNFGVIQTGLLTADYAPRRSSATFLDNEGDNGLKNVRYSVGMARATDPNSAKSEFYINLRDNTVLDTTEDKWGYAVFGRVIEGIDVVDRIAGVPTRTRGTREDIPVDPIIVQRAYMTTLEAWQASRGQDTTASGQ